MADKVTEPIVGAYLIPRNHAQALNIGLLTYHRIMRKALIFGFLAAMLALFGMPAHAASTTTIVAVGDVARLHGGQYKTAQLTKNLKPNAVLIAGDLAYRNGSTANFTDYFEPAWRSVLTKYPTLAVPGNHEYNTANAAGYRSLVKKYSLPKTGRNLWWTKNIDGWTIIGLDSERTSSTTQRNFLTTTLRNNNGRPTIVMWHKPTFTRGLHVLDRCITSSWWNTISADADVKIVLWGHDHNYEQVDHSAHDAAATYCDTKLRAPNHLMTTFVVGTGGAELRGCTVPNVAGELLCGTSTKNYGVLKLTLTSHSYAWSFRRVDDFTKRPSSTGIQKDSGSHSF